MQEKRRVKFNGLRAHAIRIKLAELNGLNVDPSGTDKQRKAALFKVIDDVLTIIAESESTKGNSKSFLLNVAWHEGARLTTRKQYDNGPARSFYQFEAWRAKDDFEQGVKTDIKKLATLVEITNQPKEKLISAFNQIGSKDKFYPKDNLVGLLMETDDRFATCLIRYSLMRYTESIPTTNVGHADYWFKYWKRELVGGSADDIKKLKEKFVLSANEVQAI